MITTAFSLDTPDGPFGVIVRGDTVLASGWSGDLGPVAARNRSIGDWREGPGPADVVEAVEAFYGGDLGAVAHVPVDQPGSPFLQTVWTALREIPAGSPTTYGALATDLGRPSAARAVGRACGLNAPALFVPCHRVTGASGALTGFAWGVEVKRSLLAREAPGERRILQNST